ncbi:AMP-binding protein [Aquisalimonas sp.]|uniref:AMP-binding protein n=1 Tax=Aquisalimonas sp. TaxID=1872621 RepID=UPI0025C349D1|nr:AMP-binding protein [Aquisalimonas sp.]
MAQRRKALDTNVNELEAGLLDLIRDVARELHPGRRVPELGVGSDLERDAGLDSLGRVELMLRLERRFGARVPDEVAVQARTPADLIEALSLRGAQVTDQATRMAPVRRDETVPAATVPRHAETIPEALDWHAEHSGDRRCVTLYEDGGGGPALTYAELREGAAVVADGLRERRVGPGDTVALMLPTGLDFFFAFHGVLWAGAIPVPLYPPVRASQVEDHLRRIVSVLDNAGTRCFIASRETVQAGRLLKSLAPGVDTVTTVAELRESAGVAARVPRTSADIAFLQYTSGTTGQPKGVTLTHGNLLANILGIGEVIEASQDDHFVSWLPLYHDMGLIGACLGTMYHGVPLTLMSPLQFMARPQRWLWAIHSSRGTLSAAPNFAYDLCAQRLTDEDLEGLDLSSWRYACNGAEPISPRTLEAFNERFRRYGFAPRALKPVYGLAEASVGLTFPPLEREPLIDRVKRDHFERTGEAEPADAEDPNPRYFVACGRVLPGHDIRVVDERNRPLPERRQGELQFRGPSCTQGYFRNPEATERLIVDGGWLNSGDLAYLDEGELYLTGRVKDVIIRGGRNYYPYELEQAVSQVPGIRRNNVAVFASDDPEAGTERLVVVAETRETDSTARARMEQDIREATVRLMETAPDVVKLVPPASVPKTSSGKIRRVACRELYQRGELGKSTGGLAPQLSRLILRSALPLLRRGARAGGRGMYALWFWLQGLAIGIPMAFLLLLTPGRSARAAIARGGSRLMFALVGSGPTVRGLERLPREPCVVVSNHASYLDGPVLRAGLPGRLVFTAKRELSRNWLLAPLLKRAGATWVERFDRRRSLEDLDQAMEQLDTGERLLFFPEGRLSAAPGLQDFRIGAFMAAVRKGVPVVPMVIRGSRKMLSGYSFRPRPGSVELEVGTPMVPKGDDWDAALELRDRARNWILQRCGEPDLASGEAGILGGGNRSGL